MRYALLDVPHLGSDLTTAQALNPNHVSLYRGPEDPQMAEMAPMLFWYEADDPFAQWLDQRWGDSLGIEVVTDVQPDELRKHLRRFLLIKTDDGEQLYFRYYDPRVLNVFLPTCDAEQIRTLFGPIQAFVVEDPANAQSRTFTQQDGQLMVDTVSTQVHNFRTL